MLYSVIIYRIEGDLQLLEVLHLFHFGALSPQLRGRILVICLRSFPLVSMRPSGFWHCWDAVGRTWLSKRRAAGQNMPSGYFVHDAKSPWQWARDSHFQILKEMQVDVLVQ